MGEISNIEEGIVIDGKETKGKEKTEKTRDDFYGSDRKDFYDDFKKYILDIIKNSTTKKYKYFSDSGKNYGKIIALNAPWGYGKSFFCEVLANDLRRGTEGADGKKIIVKNINAWNAQKYKNPLYAFILANDNDDDIYEDIKMSISLDLPFFTIDMEGNDIHKEFSDLKKRYEMIQNPNEDEHILYIIDELDRCSPAYIMDFLEVLQYVISMNCAVVSVNLNALNETFTKLYGAVGEKYYDKIFYDWADLPFGEYEFISLVSNYYSDDIKDEVSFSNYHDSLSIIFKALLSMKNNITPRDIYKNLDSRDNVIKGHIQGKTWPTYPGIISDNAGDYGYHAYLYALACKFYGKVFQYEDMDKKIKEVFEIKVDEIDEKHKKIIFKHLNYRLFGIWM